MKEKEYEKQGMQHYDKQYLLPLGRLVLKNEDVCLIRTMRAAGDPVKNWVATDVFAICLPEKKRFFGYEVIGRCDLRYGYNRQLYYGGNIGYRVFEPYRGNHMAEKATRLLLEQAKARSMPYVIITCNPDNYPSRKTLEHLQEDFDGTLLETVDLPPDNDMYQKGERSKCIFYFPLSEAPEWNSAVGDSHSCHHVVKVLANGNYEAFSKPTEFRPTIQGGRILIESDVKLDGIQ